ncbi:type II secretion system major pseudopilin GspG [Aestuariibacter halophilus]|uniref:Type II secretion system core protein G n=1 Tax=Fluctibacter halophilus TaxID=226011 RepID=A0ABS8G2P4_9ALTE|nr:type II secretion system major pseudopilin GspG [Aestuariibacter halophilus]MCC2614803.1 type II secretion system major pseudopilin GspG [Aestuariibacter halophilus]
MRMKNSGFTLVELLIVIVIIGLLASLVAPEMFSKVDSSRQKTATAQMQMFQTALDTYRLDMGRYPKTLNELVQSSENGWDGPYLPKSVPNDPWGNPYVYAAPGTNGKAYELKSLGADGQPGGQEQDADIIHE